MRSLLFLPLAVAACGDNVSTPAMLGGTIQGLRGSSGLVLANNGEVIEVAADGSFQFPTPVALGASYAISIVSQPTSPSQICTLSNASGVVDQPGETISVGISCKTSSYRVAGNVVGLDGSGLKLKNGTDTIAVAANGTFMFPTSVLSGESFAVTVDAQPTGRSQTCSVSGGDGTIGGGDVTSILVNCATDKFAVGGTISGLRGQLVLQSTSETALAAAENTITVSANGEFAFPHTIASGDDYTVSVLTQPETPSQTCVITNGSGHVVDAAIDTIAISCTTNQFAVRGTVTGLAGTGLVLQNNHGDDLAIGEDGAFLFSTTIESGELFDVTVANQPAGLSQTCTITGGEGMIGGADVTTVVVNCSTNRYAVGGTIGGLVGTVELRNGDDVIAVSANGTFAFPTTIESGSAYGVTIASQPTAPWQTCALVDEQGTVIDRAIETVAITCTTNRYAIEGTVSGLANGNTLAIHNGLASTTASGNGAFSFPVSFDSGSAYQITVDDPTSPVAQSCAVAQDSGMIGGANVSDVAITCTTRAFTVGGTLTGLADGTTVTLRNNNGDDLVLATDIAFTFATPVASGAAYAVTVATQPEGQSCSVTQGTGIVGAQNVTSVAVSCSASITRWTDGTNQWPDQACNPTNSFGNCNTNDPAFANKWATFVCQQNGYSSGVWTGNKQAGCSGPISMYCQEPFDPFNPFPSTTPSPTCNARWETTCAPSDQTKIELTCTP